MKVPLAAVFALDINGPFKLVSWVFLARGFEGDAPKMIFIGQNYDENQGKISLLVAMCGFVA